tara:strand:- start:5097 stop:5558 length:462 start_codon:yes stop_codon:yes gene_type:complete
MIKQLYFLGLLTFSVQMSFSQVGIGTVTPSAELEIETSSGDIPALKLNPQTNPIGNEMGQLAVIGDKLYMYDDVRAKYLSVETTALQFAKDGTADNDPLRFGGDVKDNGSGAKMPFNGTIVYCTIQSSGEKKTKNLTSKLTVSMLEIIQKTLP